MVDDHSLSIIQRLLRETRLQLLEHPRFYSGVDAWPLSCYGLTTVISAAVHVVAKHHENNRGYKQPTETDHIKTSYYCLV